jgi:hypothetical protein
MYTILYPELEARLRAPQVRTTAAQPVLSEEPDQHTSVAGVRTLRTRDQVATAHRGTEARTSAAIPPGQAGRRGGRLSSPILQVSSWRRALCTLCLAWAAWAWADTADSQEGLYDMGFWVW